MNDHTRPRSREAAEAPTSDLGAPAAGTTAADADTMEPIGSGIGPYRLIERLGEGGFGTVFRAEQDQPVRRTVAIKVIKLGMDTRQVVARFEQERQALALMDHPHIAKVFDAGATAGGRPYFVMEFCRGEPITLFCDHHRLTIAERLHLFLQVCGAVQHAHQKGVIHRDIKPSNVLVSMQDDAPFARVIDFGIAKSAQPGLEAHASLTTADQLVGTPEFMSPEQAEGSRDIDTRSDVYSLGVLLHALITGTTPVDATRLRAAPLAEVRRLICEQDPPAPSRRVSESVEALRVVAHLRGTDPARLPTLIRGDLDWIVLRALEKDRSRRYASAQELADDVARHLAGEPVLAAPPSLRYRLAKAMRRHRALSAATGLVAAAIIGGGLFSLIGFVQARRERDRAVRSESETAMAIEFLSDMLKSVEPGNRGREVSMRQVLDVASGTITVRFAGMPDAEARLRRTIGNAYRALGDYGPADDHLTVALALRQREHGDRDPSTLQAIGDLAGLRQEQGRYAEAEALARSILDGPIPVGFEEHAIGVRNNLAQTLVRLGRLDEALDMQRLVVADARRTLGPGHVHTLGLSANLASMLESTGRVGEAEALLRGAVADGEALHGRDDPATLFLHSQLAGFRLARRQWPEAKEAYETTLERQTAILGPRHPDTGRTQSSLGVVLMRLGQDNAALPLLRHGWITLQEALGSAHPDTLAAAFNLLQFEAEHGWPSTKEATADAHTIRGVSPEVVAALESLRLADGTTGADSETLNSAAWFLLEVEPTTLRDPSAALRLAQRACIQARAMHEAALWSYLDTLALALARTGAWSEAAATQREALSLLPPTDERFRGEMSERLAEYESGETP